MTDVTVGPSAELEPVLKGALELLTTEPNASLDQLAALVAISPETSLADEAKPFPDLPRPVTLTDDVRRALTQLPKVFNSVEIAKRRSLAQTEIDLLTIEQNVIALIGTRLASRLEVIKETIRVHMDIKAEEDGIAIRKAKTDPDSGAVIVPATPRDQKGHYLLAQEGKPHQVQAGPVAWSQEFSQGAPAPSDGVLQKAYKAGTISREDYLAVTREARPFDEIRARDLIRQAPARGLAVLRRITVTGPARASLYLRKQA